MKEGAITILHSAVFIYRSEEQHDYKEGCVTDDRGNGSFSEKHYSGNRCSGNNIRESVSKFKKSFGNFFYTTQQESVLQNYEKIAISSSEVH